MSIDFNELSNNLDSVLKMETVARPAVI